ncbi:MAG TPA: DUF4956 domain-containing protein [Gemmatimonadales bacterium]|nr:DUF4956 domain-containing protein [Gemmatimonadales bacterium]
MNARAAFPILARLAAYYAVLAGVAVFLARWLPAAGTVPAAAGPLGRPGAALAAAVGMLGALTLVIPVAWTYMRTKPRARYDASLVQTVIILPVAVAGIVLIVQNSLALAFSLAGIVAAVRFRNTLRDTKDAVYIFVAIALGLAAGVQAFSAAFVMSLVYVLLVLALWRFDVGAAPAAARVTGVLVVDAASASADGPIAQVLDLHAKRWKRLHEVPGAEGRATLTYLARLRRRTSPDALLGDVRRAAGPGAVVQFEPPPPPPPPPR